MSEFTYGALRDDDDLEAIGDVLCRCFNFPADGWAGWRDKVGRECFRGVFRADRLVGGLCIHDFGQWFGGRCVPMGGIAAVGIAPGERGTGAATALMEGAVREMRAAGTSISTLFPAAERLYRKSGYERAGYFQRLSCRASSLAPGAHDLPMWAVDPKDAAAFECIQQAYAARHNGHLRRTGPMWAWMADDRDSRPHAYLVGPESSPEGYLLFRQPKAEKNYDIFVRDLAALTARAFGRIWTFLADHRSLAQRVEWPSGPGDPALQFLPEPVWQVSREMIWSLRLVDVPAALAGRGYPTGLDEAIHLEIRDEVLPENDGRFVLRIANGRGTVEPGGEGRLSLHVREMASLYSGFSRAEHLRALDRLFGDDESVAALDSAFAGPAPWMPDTF